MIKVQMKNTFDTTVVSMTRTKFSIKCNQGDLKSATNERKREMIKLLINHLGVADEKPSYFKRVILPFLRRAISSAKRSLVGRIANSRAWRAIKRRCRRGVWGSYHF